MVDPQTGNKNYNYFDSDPPNLQSADLGNLWAILVAATVNVETVTVAKFEWIFFKGNHQDQNCQKLFKAIELGDIQLQEKCKK